MALGFPQTAQPSLHVLLVAFFFGFFVFLSQHFSVSSSLLFSFIRTIALQGYNLSPSLKTLRCNQSLDFRSLSFRFLWLRFAFRCCNRFSDDILSDIIVFGQVEQFSDLANSLWSQTTGYKSVG